MLIVMLIESVIENFQGKQQESLRKGVLIRKPLLKRAIFYTTYTPFGVLVIQLKTTKI